MLLPSKAWQELFSLAKAQRAGFFMENTVPSSFRNAEEIVSQVMNDFPETRSSDKKLIIKVWEIQGFYLTEEQIKKLFKCLSSETIRRTRQKLNEKGMFLPSPQTWNKRHELAENHRNYHISKESNPRIRREYKFNPETQTYQVL